MSKINGFKLAVVLVVVLAAITAIAADGTVSVNVRTPALLKGQKIAQGDYKVVWSGKDDSLLVKFIAGKKEVASAPAKMIELKNPAAYTSLVNKEGNIVEIDISGKKTAIVFAD